MRNPPIRIDDVVECLVLNTELRASVVAWVFDEDSGLGKLLVASRFFEDAGPHDAYAEAQRCVVDEDTGEKLIDLGLVWMVGDMSVETIENSGHVNGRTISDVVILHPAETL